jgi:hypothetical protein
MVATCAINGWDVATYLNPNHPLQLACREELERLSGEKVSQIAVDGCGAPLFAITLSGLAKAIHALTVSKDLVHQEVVDACREFPIMVSGEGRLPTLAMQKVPGLVCNDGAEGVVRELRSMIGLGSANSKAWTPDIVTTVATTGQGLPDLVTAITKHHEWAVSSGDRALRSIERAKLNLRRAVLDSITEQMNLNTTTLDSLSAQVASGAISTELAVKQILQDLNNS